MKTDTRYVQGKAGDTNGDNQSSYQHVMPTTERGEGKRGRNKGGGERDLAPRQTGIELCRSDGISDCHSGTCNNQVRHWQLPGEIKFQYIIKMPFVILGRRAAR